MGSTEPIVTEDFLQLATTREDWSRENVTVVLRERDVLKPVFVVTTRGRVVPPYERRDELIGDPGLL